MSSCLGRHVSCSAFVILELGLLHLNVSRNILTIEMNANIKLTVHYTCGMSRDQRFSSLGKPRDARQ